MPDSRTRVLSSLLLAVTVIAASGCQTSASSISLEVHPDGSGELQTTRIVVPERETSGIKGLHARQDFAFEVIVGSFGDLSTLDIGGITARLEPNTEGYSMSVHVPTTSKATWFTPLGLDAPSAERLARAAKAWSTRDGKSRGLPPSSSVSPEFDALLEPTFILKLKLPGEIRSHRVIGRTLPDGWRLEPESQNSGLREAGSERVIRLQIPLAALHAGTVPSLDFQVTCGPATEDALESWRKAKRRSR